MRLYTTCRLRNYIVVIVWLVLLSTGSMVAAESEEGDSRKAASESVWKEQIKPRHFPGRKIIEDTDNRHIRIRAPEWIDDPTTVPVTVRATESQKPTDLIQRLWLYIDRNPLPLVGTFELTPLSGRADLAMKVRVDNASFIRVIAETSDDKFYMDKVFMRTAGGGCSAPPGPGMQVSLEKRGEMKLKFLDDPVAGQPVLTQLMVRHPNVTGLSIDVVTRNRPPPYFLDELLVQYDDTTVFKAALTFAISQDPALRFYFQPEQSGKLSVTARDTKDQTYQSIIPVSVSVSR